MATFWTKISRVGLVYLMVLSSIATEGHAQGNDVHCKYSDGDWNVFRTEQGDVCEVAHYFLNKCLPNKPPQQMNTLTGDSWYKASQFGEVPDCACTMIMYNLLSACAGCQKVDIDDSNLPGIQWPSVLQYEDNKCWNHHSLDGTTHIGPEGSGRQNWTELAPLWSKQLNDTSFDLPSALVLAKGSNPNATSTTTSTSDPASTSDPTAATTATPAASTQSSKAGPNVGAIVGGVVGALLILGAIVGLVLFLRHRKRRARDVAPSDEFLKPEYYSSPPLLPVQGRGDSEYRDDMEEQLPPTMPAMTQRLSWAGGMVATRRRETGDDEEGDMLPPFTQGTYIGPSPHEKGVPERRETGESDATAESNTLLLQSPTRSGTSANHSGQ